VFKGDEGVDHCVADEMHAVVSDAFCAKVAHRVLRMKKQQVAEFISDDAVDLFRHASVETPKARFDVPDRNLKLRGDQGGGKGRVHVAGHQDEIWPKFDEEWFQPLHNPRGLDSMGSRTHAK
jgi:hypothetical protein